jgi:hypothetical protein
VGTALPTRASGWGNSTQRHWIIEDGEGNPVGQVTDRSPGFFRGMVQPDTFVINMGALTGPMRALALTAGLWLDDITTQTPSQ